MPREISYQLLIDVPRALRCVVGRLGEFDLPAGRYVYTGSAMRGLDARIARHLRHDKPLRWHVDYLLAGPGVRVVGVVRSRRPECALNRMVRGSLPVPGFGASDCRAGCGAHLKYLGKASAPEVGTSRRAGIGAFRFDKAAR
jgi:Uri superfamily endonuclease